MANTHDINVIMDLKNSLASVEFNGKKVESNFKIVKINNYSKMASISYFFNENKKWIFKWIVWNEKEQFVGFDQYHKINQKDNPWTDLASWSYISKPQKGTCQTNDVYRIFYKSNMFPKVKHINFSVKGSKYGDWDNTLIKNVL